MQTAPNPLTQMAGLIDAVVVGCSAGGIEALGVILRALPPGYALPVIVVIHISPDSRGTFEGCFPEANVRVKEADEKEFIAPGTIYFAPPNYHLLIEGDRSFSLTTEEAVNFSRPSIDVLFESAAEIYGSRLLGIVLTGANEDGAHGLKVIRERGGFAIAQNPETAKYPTMPKAAINAAEPQFVLDLKDIGNVLSGLDNRA